MLSAHQFWEFFSPILQAGLANTVVIGIGAWIGKNWAERRLEALKAEQAQELEKIKGYQAKDLEELKSGLADISARIRNEIDRSTLVFKTHFELEFKNYIETWRACDENLDNAARAARYLQMDMSDPDRYKEISNVVRSMYDTCVANVDVVRKHRPFIDRDIAVLAKSLAGQCAKECQIFLNIIPKTQQTSTSFDQDTARKEADKAIEHLASSAEEIADRIAARIKGMYVVP